MKKYLLILLVILSIFKSYLQAQTLYSISEGGDPFKLRTNLYIFISSTPDLGGEPYVTDGSQSGTSLLKDINSGSSSSYPTSFHRINDTVCIFSANDGSNNHGTELWRSNGTSDGTYIVADLATGPSSSFILFSDKQLNGQNFFTQKYNSVITLYITNGSQSGTVPLTGVQGNSADIRVIDVANGIMYFCMNSNSNWHLWRTDGTINGTFELTTPILPGFSPKWGAALPNSFVFCASDSIHGEELWVTDGSDSGTIFLKDIIPGISGSSPELFNYVNGRILFNTTNTNFETELWATDGTGSGTVQLGDSTLHSWWGYEMFKAADGNAFFNVIDNNYNSYLWQTDGTQGGTSVIYYSPYYMSYFNSGGADTVLEEFGLKFLIRSILLQEFETQSSIWSTDGTSSGTQEVFEYPVICEDPIEELTDVCGRIFCRMMEGDDNDIYYHLWEIEQDTAYQLSMFPNNWDNLEINFVDDGAIFFTGSDSTGSNIYRLQVCPATDFQNISTTNSLSLFPNPNDGLFTLQLPDNLSEAEVRVNDMMGKCRYATKLSASQDRKLNLQLENIPPGIYSLQVTSDEKRWQQIFIKQ